MKRRLAAILAADVVGYSRLMGADEEATLARLQRTREVIDGFIEARQGRVFGAAGDSVIAEFPSPVEAVRCAVEIQQDLEKRNAELGKDRRMRLRIGVNFGDVMAEGEDILGDGVNVAARLEALAPPGGICVSDQVAGQIAGKLDTPFARAGRHKLKNIAKSLEVWCWPAESAGPLRRAAGGWRRWTAAGAAALAAAAAVAAFLIFQQGEERPLPTGPRIAVIPFKDIEQNPDDAFFSDGLTKDINAHLARFSNLFVIAPSSVGGFRDNADCETIRNELEADYILEGTVRRSADRLRVTTTFTDARSCRQLDSPGPFDRDLSAAGVLDVQLEIAEKVVAQVGSADSPLFNASVQEEIRRKAPDSLEAYECVLLTYWFYETFDPERHRKARACLERAVKIDPDYSLAWSRLAFSYIEAKKYAIDTPSDWAALSRKAADRAVALDPDNPDAYYALAVLSQVTGEDPVVFRTFAEKAIELNPNDAFVLADLGTWMGYTGAWEKGKEWVNRAIQLNPKHQGWVYNIWHLHHYLKGDYRSARDVGLKMNLPNNYMVQASLTAAYAMNGEQEMAERTLAHLREIRPDYEDDPRAPFRTRGMPPELIEGLMEGLRKAGLEVPPADPLQ